MERKRTEPDKPLRQYQMKWTNIYIVEVPEGEETEKGAERIFEEKEIADFPNSYRHMNITIQETQFQVRWIQRDPHWDIL